jgi:hypothetical protein
MKLYSGPLSLFTAKVRIALDEKALPYERIEAMGMAACAAGSAARAVNGRSKVIPRSLCMSGLCRRINRPLKNVGEAAKTRQKWPKKRSLL